MIRMYDVLIEKAVRKNSILQCGLKKARENPESDWSFLADIINIQFGIEVKGSRLSAIEKKTLSKKLKDAFCYLASKGFE